MSSWSSESRSSMPRNSRTSVVAARVAARAAARSLASSSAIVTGHLVQAAGVEPALEDDGGGHLVDDLAPGGTAHAALAQRRLGGHGGEALVVGLHRHPDHGSERLHFLQ